MSDTCNPYASPEGELANMLSKVPLKCLFDMLDLTLSPTRREAVIVAARGSFDLLDENMILLSNENDRLRRENHRIVTLSEDLAGSQSAWETAAKASQETVEKLAAAFSQLNMQRSTDKDGRMTLRLLYAFLDDFFAPPQVTIAEGSGSVEFDDDEPGLTRKKPRRKEPEHE